MPLHPALVHLPLGLAVILPLIAAGFGWAFWTGRVRLRAWGAIVALQVVLLTSGLVALQTGRGEEEKVEKVVSESAIEQHEEAAEAFLWAVGLTLLVSALALGMPRPGASKALVGAGTVMTIAVLALALRVGHVGGRLVYTNGAASAYTTQASPADGAAGAKTNATSEDERDKR